MRKLFRILPIALLSLGCATSVRLSDPLVQRLSNRGPVALSPENPFLAANLLVSREMERSAEVKGFVEHKGGPRALEVVKDSLSPLILYFYYPESREVFTLEEMEQSWLITGPAPITQDKMRRVAALTRDFEGEPKLESPSGEPPPPSPTMAVTVAPVTPTVAAILPGNELQQIIDSESAAQAEITPKGDLVHYVGFSGETLSLIARWYTGDRNNAARIARINELKKPGELAIGDQIVIPSYILKNNKRLTESALRRLQRLAASEL